MKVFHAHVPLIIAMFITGCGSSPSEPGDTPSPSILTIDFTGGEECQVTATWTICADANFSSYAVYRSSIPNISENVSSAEVLAVYDDPNQRTYVDNDVDWVTQYYYAIRTGNSDEEYSWSNEEEILTPSSGGGSGVTILEGPIQNPTLGTHTTFFLRLPGMKHKRFASHMVVTSSPSTTRQRTTGFLLHFLLFCRSTTTSGRGSMMLQLRVAGNGFLVSR